MWHNYCYSSIHVCNSKNPNTFTVYMYESQWINQEQMECLNRNNNVIGRLIYLESQMDLGYENMTFLACHKVPNHSIQHNAICLLKNSPLIKYINSHSWSVWWWPWQRDMLLEPTGGRQWTASSQTQTLAAGTPVSASSPSDPGTPLPEQHPHWKNLLKQRKRNQQRLQGTEAVHDIINLVVQVSQAYKLVWLSSLGAYTLAIQTNTKDGGYMYMYML